MSLITVGHTDCTRSVVDCGMYHAVPSNSMVYEDGQTIGLLCVRYSISNQEYSFMYPGFIFDVDVSSFLDKAFHCVVTAFASCNMQGSSLIGKKNK